MPVDKYPAWSLENLKKLRDRTSKEELASLREEKERRGYYQDIVYHICDCINTLDSVATSFVVADSSASAFKGYVSALFLELGRLRKGDLTEEEAEIMCHPREGVVTKEQFEQGCRDFQAKLFGG